ncbi:hypothetical protein JNB71_16905 [Rhizobium herbae]|uniref:Uncharacterized protein n=1 Tax=Rhizobium herbae TaxID=508661 RepID=A0ABS7HCY1_9HYPH|nr:hypothetical protein [Rhizobium herbae]MBW9064983.1 hypothetical protein [Rhizobium herbae]
MLLEAEQTVYCLDLALEQIAKELRHRADVSHEIASYFKEGIKRQWLQTVVGILPDGLAERYQESGSLTGHH